MKTFRRLLAFSFVFCSIALWAQFGPGGGGGFGGGRPGGNFGGDRPGGDRQGQTQNRDRQTTQQQNDNTPSGPKIGSVAGIVADEKNIPIEYATATLIDNKTQKVITGVITNPKGGFTIKQLPAGEYKIKISYLGFKEYSSQPFTLSSSHRAQDLGKITLAENANQLDDIVITAEVTTVENRIDKQVVNVGRDLATAGASTRDVFEKLPMVDVDFEGNISMRGSSNVRVLLDNRPTNMTVQDLLETLPADAIDKVEIITNPTAKQDPDGESGIINIITKKNGALYGLTFITRVGVDTKNKWNGGVNFAYHMGKVVVYTNYNFRYSAMDTSGETYRANYNLTQLYPQPYLNYMNSNSSNTSVSHMLRAGIDYLPNKKTALSYSLDYMPSSSDSRQNSWSYFLPLDTPMDQMTKEIAQQIVENYRPDLENYLNRHRVSESHSSRDMLRNSINLRRDYNSTDNLEIDVNFDVSHSDSPNRIDNQVRIGQNLVRTLDNSQSYPTDKELTAKIDYAKNFGRNTRLQTGAKADLQWRNTPYFYYIDSPDTPEAGPQPDLNRSNHFQYNEQLYSAYATVSQKVKNFTFLLGLRLEETIYRTVGLGIENHNGEIVYVKDKDVVIDRDYFSLYPSAMAMYRFGNNNAINLSYSRRVGRPNSNDLNPTPRFTDPLYVTIGNPYLDPSFSNSLDLRYTGNIGSKGTFGLSTFFRNTTDKIQTITQRENPVDPSKTEPGTLYTTKFNIGSDYNIGANLYASYKFFPWWNANLNVNYNYKHTDIPDNPDITNRSSYVPSSISFSGRLFNSFNITRTNTRIQFGLMYSAPEATFQGSTNGRFTSSAAISQDFLKKKLTFTVSMSDLFNTQSYRGDTRGDDFILYNNNSYTSRIVRFGVTYKFNEMKFKDKRVKSGTNSELPAAESSSSD